MVNSHSMVCYDPKWATVVNKAAPAADVDKNGVFAMDGRALLAFSSCEPITVNIYDNSRNKWARIQKKIICGDLSVYCIIKYGDFLFACCKGNAEPRFAYWKIDQKGGSPNWLANNAFALIRYDLRNNFNFILTE